jgi:uncharacterized protein (TIGR03086 family)
MAMTSSTVDTSSDTSDVTDTRSRPGTRQEETTGTGHGMDATHREIPDFREPVARAQRWITGLLAGVRTDQLAGPTPCEELDVARLVQHLFGVADRMEAMGHGRPADSVPAFADALPDELASTYAARVAVAQEAWADEVSLHRPVTAPWGTMPGGFVLAVYLTEHLTHGWDLAVATGQHVEADADLAELGLQSAGIAIPPEPRGGPMPFGPVVEPAPDAGPTERLANYLGHRR